MGKWRGFIWAPAVASLAWAAAGQAAVVAISPLRDNTLYESPTGHLSNGAGENFFAGTNGANEIRRGLIAFDVAGNIPAGATITSVMLQLHMSRTAAAAEEIALHRMLADWGEGASEAPGREGSGGLSETGDATWLHAFYPDVFWAMPGGDLVADPSAIVPVIGNGFYVWSEPQLTADIQLWLDSPSANFGWMVRGNETIDTTAKRFDSRENPDPGVRPLLTIEYNPVPEPGALCLLGWGSMFIRKKCRRIRQQCRRSGV